MAGRPPRKRTVRKRPAKTERNGKTMCTPQVISTFADAYASGVSIVDAAHIAGITHTTAHDWMNRGEAGEEPFATFVYECNKALALAVVESAKFVKRSKDWRARLEWLGRVRRSEFGRQPEIDARSIEQTTIIVRDLGQETPIDAEVRELHGDDDAEESTPLGDHAATQRQVKG